MITFKGNSYKNWALAVMIIIIPLTIGVCNEIKGRIALRKTAIVIGEIEGFEPSRGARIIDVMFNYKGKIISTTIEKYDVDSLKINTKIVLKISRDYPSKYIEYIGVYNATNDDSN
ncbi:MAG TPA: hypothetical protein VGN20_06690 [Mucilaginibacter sp.]|jgi:hypothetical protein